ncbi:hypothetical protein J5N97_025917 [Dioscorea zingiberensis]|uniref:Uncharacterized protein n=1 Tax=Dioscorea zingiberensis TaxID=325984 RepID=A0A9D5C2H4_9LILI|nr:hypothetical protein J5N97_025917 [Dioscorea zingiberensis]
MRVSPVEDDSDLLMDMDNIHMKLFLPESNLWKHLQRWIVEGKHHHKENQHVHTMNMSCFLSLVKRGTLVANQSRDYDPDDDAGRAGAEVEVKLDILTSTEAEVPQFAPPE